MQLEPQLIFTPTSDRWVTLQRYWKLLTQLVNGGLSFGDGSKADNISGAWISVTTPLAPNTDFTVTHLLNRLPVGYLIMQKSASCDVYTGSVPASKTQLTLKATTTGVVLKLFVLSLLLFFAANQAKAQAVVFHDIATYNSSGTVKVVPSALITVCPGSSFSSTNQAPCAPASVALFTNSTLTNSLSNPFHADANGNFSFWVLTGSYTVSITGAAVQGFSYQITPGGGVGALPGTLLRIQPVLGTALTSGDFTLTGWGAGATVSNVLGMDTAFSFTITAGIAPTVNPTAKLTFKDGPWLTIQSVSPQWVGGTGTASDIVDTNDLASLTLTYVGLPVATNTYSFNVVVMGNSNVISPPQPPINPVLLNPGAIQNIVGFPLSVPQLDLPENNTPGNPIAQRLRVYSKLDEKLYYRNNAGVESVIATGVAGTGTVTSVGLVLPADLFNVAGSPVNTSGNIVATKALVSPGLVYMGPPSGGAAQPFFGSLSTAYLPFTYTGNTALLATCVGSFVAGNFLTTDASGNCIDGGAPPVSATSEQWTHNVTSNTCPTSGSSFDTCTYTLTWPVAWASASYDVVCQGITPFDADNGDAGRLIPNGVSARTTTTVTFKIASAGASHVSYTGGVVCHGKL